MRDESWQWKGHVVPAELVEALKAELNQRADEIKDPVQFVTEDLGPDDEVHFDVPGMCLTERALRIVEGLGGLKLQVPSQDWDSILYEIQLLEQRTFPSGEPYYKLRGWRFCIVFTPEQRAAAIASMEAQKDAAAAEGEADDQRFADGIRKINEEAGHTVVVSAKAVAIDNPKKGSN